jgi:hypothetical protein
MAMDHSVLVALCGGVVGGLAGLLVIGLAGWASLAMNAKRLSELT